MTDDDRPGFAAGGETSEDETRAAIELARQDELGARRFRKQTLDAFAQLSPAELQHIDIYNTVIDNAIKALDEGRDAFHRGDLGRAEVRLRVAAGHTIEDGAVYLAATYQRQGRHELANAWRVIAADDGFGQDDVDRVLTAVEW